MSTTPQTLSESFNKVRFLEKSHNHNNKSFVKQSVKAFTQYLLDAIQDVPNIDFNDDDFVATFVATFFETFVETYFKDLIKNWKEESKNINDVVLDRMVQYSELEKTEKSTKIHLRELKEMRSIYMNRKLDGDADAVKKRIEFGSKIESIETSLALIKRNMSNVKKVRRWVQGISDTVSLASSNLVEEELGSIDNEVYEDAVELVDEVREVVAPVNNYRRSQQKKKN